MEPIYPDVKVPLSGEDGNAFFIIGRISSALRRHGVQTERVTEFCNQATSGDYDHVLRTAMRWVTVS